jgi:histidinol-phosphate aminotransferase
LAAANAAIDDQAWMQANVQRIRASRDRLTSALRACGFQVVDSQANFVWATRPEGGQGGGPTHREIYQRLKDRKVLVRYMRFPLAANGTGNGPSSEIDGLRITVGTDEEINGLLSALKDVLA